MGYLHVILARDEPVAVILRRGPSAWYHVILWHTRRDLFTHGAWFHGRMYEEKCDLSPDGNLFVYSVHKGSCAGTPFSHAWTAISRPPWLHALVVWPQGTTYGGGGKFTGPRTLWGVSADRTHPDFPFPKDRFQIADEPPVSEVDRPKISGAEWSGTDHQGAPIYTRKHVLYRRKNRKEIVVADFTGLIPAPTPAPELATRPL